jgi:hypothetical protein
MFRAIVGLAMASLLTGCAHFTHYQANIGDPEVGVSMGAKQRVVLMNKHGTDPKRICAEPSPYALSALGASLSGSLVDPTSSKQLAAALGESSASIGLRTTSIQLMRDAMYRACEAYMSHGITEDTYADLQGHAQTLIVGLLAIEQLTSRSQ